MLGGHSGGVREVWGGGEDHPIQSERPRHCRGEVLHLIRRPRVCQAHERPVLRRQEDQELLLGRSDQLHGDLQQHEENGRPEERQQ